MIKKNVMVLGLLALATPVLSFAVSASIVPNSGFYIGLGGSYNTVDLKQDLYASGVSDVYNSSNVLVATGSAGGDAAPFNDTQSKFAPEFQLGYFKHFNGSRWLWGTKFIYQYMNSTSTDRNFSAFQAGSFVSFNSDTFTGHVVISSAQMSVKHTFALMPNIGYSFKHSLIYFGLGPALLSTNTHIYGATGYADINGIHTNITGTPSNFSSSKWMWGGEAQLGAKYFLSPSWFIDSNYSFAITGNYGQNYTGPFTSVSNSHTNIGTLYIRTHQQYIVQAVGVSIDKLF